MALVICVLMHFHFGRPSSAPSILYWSLVPSPHWSIPWESIPSQWYHGCMYCSIYFVLFDCGELFCSSHPPHALAQIHWVIIAQTLCPSSAPLIVTCASLPPMSHWCKFGITKSDLLFPTVLLIAYCIGHWSVGGLCTLSKTLMLSVYGENPVAHLENWILSVAIVSQNNCPLWPTQWCRRSHGSNGYMHMYTSCIWPSLAPYIVNLCWNTAPVFLVTVLFCSWGSAQMVYYSKVAHTVANTYCKFRCVLVMIMTDGHGLTWKVCPSCHSEVCGLTRPLSLLWEYISHSVPWHSAIGLAGTGVVQYILKKVGIGTTLHLLHDLCCLLSKLDSCSTSI